MKKAIAVLVTLALIFALCSCTDKKETDKEKETSPMQTQTETTTQEETATEETSEPLTEEPEELPFDPSAEEPFPDDLDESEQGEEGFFGEDSDLPSDEIEG